ncbi:MAG: hypothetical protein IIA60_10915 [Candidatus Marinimicrobia bacterium]|nr:hypothetical protein [Candidatus Neomarinimicrobiota bacterium]
MVITKRSLLILGFFSIATGLLAEGGTIKGTIHFEGAGPKLRTVKMDADPVCKASHDGPVYSETVVINDNSTLKNVLVSIEAGLEGQTFPVPEEPVVLDQTGCRYEPHVWGAMAGQPVEIRNSDRTLHNVHALSVVNPQFNMAMPKIVRKKTRIFKKPEDVFAIKCDVHPWMKTWVGIFDHPFFATSDTGGSYTLADLPDGTYTIRAWHERLPAMTKEITIKEGETITLDFTFEPPKKKKK